MRFKFFLEELLIDYFKKDYTNCKDEVPNYRGFYDNSFTNKKHIKNK